MGRQVVYDQSARSQLKIGVDIIADAVKVTLGPKGRNVIIDLNGLDPIITKDGVTVAKYVHTSNPMNQIGVQMVRQVAQKTAEDAGDGTTTATVLAQAIVTAGLKNVEAGANPMDIKRGIDKAVEAVVANLKKQSVTIGENSEKIIHVATLSANGDEKIGKLIAEAVTAVGTEGVITIEESKSSETSVTTVEGMQFDRGYISRYFVNTPEKMEVQFNDPILVFVNKKLNNMTELIKPMETCLRSGKPTVIICDDMEGDALKLIVINHQKNGLPIAVVKSPGFGSNIKNVLEDVAIATGGIIFSETSGYSLDKLELRNLGRADRIVISKNSTTITKGHGDPDAIKFRVDELRKMIEDADNSIDKNNLKERLAKLTAGVSVIYVGAATEAEMKEKMDRVDDSLHATRAALAEGIVPGGGVALIRAISSLKSLKGDNEDENTGIQIVKKAIEEPLRQICNNAAVEGSVIINEIINGKGDYGYNARTGKFENLIAAGVIDPTKVTRIALENAASIASMLLTTQCVLADEPEPEKSGK